MHSDVLESVKDGNILGTILPLFHKAWQHNFYCVQFSVSLSLAHGQHLAPSRPSWNTPFPWPPGLWILLARPALWLFLHLLDWFFFNPTSKRWRAPGPRTCNAFLLTLFLPGWRLMALKHPLSVGNSQIHTYIQPGSCTWAQHANILLPAWQTRCLTGTSLSLFFF